MWNVKTDATLALERAKMYVSEIWSGLFTKVGQFEFPSLVDEQVLRLQVAVQDFPSVTVGQTS